MSTLDSIVGVLLFISGAAAMYALLNRAAPETTTKTEYVVVQESKPPRVDDEDSINPHFN